MAVVLLAFTLFSMGVFALIALVARRLRPRTPPNERCDLEENAISGREWEWVCHARCIPDHCPRAVGSPPRPRGDVACEICAALFMERHWRRLVGVAPEEDAVGLTLVAAERYALEADDTAAPSSNPRGLQTLPMFDGDSGGPTPRPVAATPGARLARRLGFLLVLGGASVLALSAALLPGYLMVACGIGLLLRGVGRGA